MPTGRATRILWHWFTLGPYHFARMAAVARQPGVELTVIESTSNDDHGWRRASGRSGFELITMSCRPLSRDTHREVGPAYLERLRNAEPDFIVESGYAEMHSLHALLEYRKMRPEVKILLWSETTPWDHKRLPLLERLKRLIVAEFDGALVAGSPHAKYMEGLGLTPESIQVVGNCVDNDFFRDQTSRIRGAQREVRTQQPYFLYVGRLIPEKNIPFLVRSYARYRQGANGEAYDLMLVGSGPEESRVRQLVHELKVQGIHFAGNKQVEQLPEFYARATCLVLPSTCEPWGLVVNEAMASGLPVLSSSACGSVGDLVIHGKTGYVFSPDDESELADYLGRIAGFPQERAEMGRAAQQQVQALHIDLYAGRVVQHVNRLRSRPAGESSEGIRSMLLRRLTAAAAGLY